MKRFDLLLLLAMILSGCEKRKERIDLTRYLSVYPGPSVVELTGDTHAMKIVVRNVSELKLTNLRLSVSSPACTARVSPSGFDQLIPGDRRSFEVLLTRDKSKVRQRYPLELTLYADGLPVPAGLDLMVDLSPVPDKGWIDVGQITIVSREGSRTTYYLLAGAPLLFLLGWLLWRMSRPKQRNSANDS
jgi:hypothetical protein